MKSNKLLDAIGMIDDTLIEKAEARRGVLKPIVRRSLISSAAAVLALVITLAVVFAPQKDATTPLTSSSQTVSTTSSNLHSSAPDTSSIAPKPSSSNTSQTTSNAPPKSNVTTVAVPTFPRYAAYPLELKQSDPRWRAQYNAWEKDCRARRTSYDYSININPFLQKSVPQILSEANGENVVYSPINVYLALGMLTEVTDGASRQQILDLLGYKDVQTLRSHANSIFKAHYSDDGVYTSLLSNSIWLDKNMAYKKQPLETIANNYYATSFSGNMGSAEYNKKYREWLNSNTGGLLKDQINELKLSKDTAISLASTIYYCSKWELKFSKDKTEKDIFHTKNGDITCSFMKQTRDDRVYFGDGFSAYEKDFEVGGTMRFILPDEGITPEELIAQKGITDLYSWSTYYESSRRAIVNFSVPKFDVSSQIDLEGCLKKLGVTDVFTRQKANFSHLMQNYKGVAVSGATHGARVMIDEDGCTATAYTVLPLGGSAKQPTEIIDFKLDRPFIFITRSEQGVPLFIGIVNQPK